MGYWSDFDIQMREAANNDVSLIHHICNCGCHFTARVIRVPGFNESETYRCPVCGEEYSAHCNSVYTVKD